MNIEQSWDALADKLARRSRLLSTLIPSTRVASTAVYGHHEDGERRRKESQAYHRQRRRAIWGAERIKQRGECRARIATLEEECRTLWKTCRPDLPELHHVDTWPERED